MNKSFVVRIDKAFDKHEIQHLGAHFLEYARQKMCHELAMHLIDQCQLFDSSSPMDSAKKYSIELTLNDRGSYEHLLKHATQEGIKQGLQAAYISRPYGFEIDYDC